MTYQILLAITVIIFAWFLNAMFTGKIGNRNSFLIFRDEKLFLVLFILDLILLGAFFVGTYNSISFKL